MGSYFDNPSPSIVARYNIYIELSQDSILFVQLTHDHGNASQLIMFDCYLRSTQNFPGLVKTRLENPHKFVLHSIVQIWEFCEFHNDIRLPQVIMNFLSGGILNCCYRGQGSDPIEALNL